MDSLLSDPDGNHLAIHSRGTNSNSAGSTSRLATGTVAANMVDGIEHTVKIVYQPRFNQVQMYMDGTQIIIARNIDVSNKVGGASGAYVGFTSSTSSTLTNAVRITKFKFDIVGIHPGGAGSQTCYGPCPSNDCGKGGTCKYAAWNTGGGKVTCVCGAGWAKDAVGACSVCAAGHYGPTCQQCAATTHSTCDEGLAGTGTRTCDYSASKGFWVAYINSATTGSGTGACDKCKAGHWGATCKDSCPGVTPGATTDALKCAGHGTCSDGKAGTGTCTCALGYRSDGDVWATAAVRKGSRCSAHHFSWDGVQTRVSAEARCAGDSMCLGLMWCHGEGKLVWDHIRRRFVSSCGIAAAPPPGDVHSFAK